MVSGKRHNKQMERQLIAALTAVCEAAKAEMPGFGWLTHDNGKGEFPAGLRVTWIFDTQANLERALANGGAERMQALTREALEEAGIKVPDLRACLQFDSEEACMRAQNGDWLARLAQIRQGRH